MQKLHNRQAAGDKMKTYIKKFVNVIFGVLLYSFGVYLSVQANIGLAPWDAFSSGLSNITNMSFGLITSITGIAILIVDVILKEKIGFATIINTVFIGLFLDLMQAVNIVPLISNFAIGIVVLFAGQLCICIATFFYIAPGMGCGPRDSLMVALGKRLTKVPIGIVRGLIEGSVLIIGWLLGAKIGLGTVISVFGISFLLQATLALLHFNIKAVVHESILETVINIKTELKKEHKKEDDTVDQNTSPFDLRSV